MSSSDSIDSLYNIQLPNESVNDVATSTLNFRQRQSDAFAALADLEAAHKEVTKATKEERKLIRKTAWKQTVPAPENLVEEKECRDNIRKRGNFPQDAAKFRRPAIPPNRRLANQRRDPTKWTHYSLADVNEDGPTFQPSSDSNASIALTFINELRERRTNQSGQSEDEKNSQSHRILFRPTRGTKKARLDEAEQSNSTVNPAALACRLDDEELQNKEDEPNPSVWSNEPPETQPVFVHRQRRLRLRDRLDDDKEDPISVSDSTTDDVEENSDSEILLNNLDEMEQDAEEDRSGDNLF